MAMAIECPTMSWSHGWDDVEHSNWAVFLAAANTVCVTHNWWYKHLIMHTGLGDPLPHLYTRTHKLYIFIGHAATLTTNSSVFRSMSVP